MKGSNLSKGDRTACLTIVKHEVTQLGGSVSMAVLERAFRRSGELWQKIVQGHGTLVALLNTFGGQVVVRGSTVTLQKKAKLPGKKTSTPKEAESSSSKEPHEAESSSTMLYVSNLAFEWEDERLRSIFADHSPVSAKVAVRKNGRSKGFGFVTFASRVNQQRALVLNGLVVDGREISVQIATTASEDPTPRSMPIPGNNNNNGALSPRAPLRQQSPPFKLVSDIASCGLACSVLSESSMVALDCEGVNLGRPGGKLCLVQLASPNAGVFVFDLLVCPGLIGAGLGALLENTRVLKVVHDCKMDYVALRELHVIMTPVFDSQLAFSVVEASPRSFSLADVIKNVTGKVHPFKASAPHLRDPSVWSIRPLQADALAYAVADVELLLEVAESDRFKRMGRKEVMNVFWKTRERIAEAVTAGGADDGADGDAGGIGGADGASRNAYETYVEVHSNAASFTDIKIEVHAEFDRLLECLPPRIAIFLLDRLQDAGLQLMDVVMDLERPVCFVRSDGPDVRVDACIVTDDDIEFVLGKCGPITDSNRACVGPSLHRCSVIRDPHSERVVGLTLRMARSVRGLAGMIGDVIGTGKSVLLVGPPGFGKTTLLRDVAFTLASEAHGKRVMVVDTNNEIAGEHTLPHRAIGRARRMKVGQRSQQYRRMLEAVQNHTPQTLIIDEIGTKQEVMEAVGVKQRGVQLIATTHGRTLSDVIRNPHLRDLLGGVNTVILSAHEREVEQSASKTRNERRMEPAFDVCLELIGLNKWRLHHDIAAAVDVVLRQLDEVVDCEVRQLDAETGKVVIMHEAFPGKEDKAGFDDLPSSGSDED